LVDSGPHERNTGNPTGPTDTPPHTHTQTITHFYTHIHVLLVDRNVGSCRFVTFSLNTRNIRLSRRQQQKIEGVLGLVVYENLEDTLGLAVWETANAKSRNRGHESHTLGLTDRTKFCGTFLNRIEAVLSHGNRSRKL